MASGLENLITKTRQMAGLSKARELDDRQLLEEFAGGDETAFTALVDRYGGLVMGVCRRILQHTQDAEDAFQATFMVLARKAGKVAWKESVANWLHGVACRISFQVRREKGRHAACSVTDIASPQATDPAWSEIKPVLDEELDRLPARYRIPLILCCLEGKTRDEAAQQLGWSVGSVKGRLERGRELLRGRLARRGLTLSAALAAILATAANTQAAVPLTVGLATVRAGMAMLAGQTAGVVSIQVSTLAQGALHAMFMSKVKFAAAVVMTVVTLGLGTGYVTHQALANGDGSLRNNPEALSSPEYVAQREGREERKAPPAVTGIVQTIDEKKINILVGRNDPAGQTFELSKDVKVVLREGRETKALKIADVKEKARVVLILDEAKKVVQSIEIAGERRPDAPGERGGRDAALIFGVLAEVDAAKRTVTLQTGGRDAPPKSTVYELAKDAKVIFRTGRLVKEGKLADLELKKPVNLRLDEAKKLVTTIEVSISTTAFGAVSEVDVAKHTITIENPRGRGENPDTKTYSLSKDVKVLYRLPTARDRTTDAATKPLALGDLAAKAQVSLQLDDDLKVVQTIDVQLPHVAGTLQDVDAKKGTVLLKQVRGMEMQLTVDKDAKIVISGKDGKLDAIGVGAEAQLILTPDRMRVLYLRTPPAEGREE